MLKLFKSKEGSTAQLVQFCVWYFWAYVITGVCVKYFQASGMKELEFLVYSTTSAMCIPLFVSIIFKWYKFESEKLIPILGFKIPIEYLYLIPSGICTAVVIPTTTLLYSLPISVMVAMTLMRGVIIIVSRLVDAIQIKQGYLTKKIYAEENWGVFFAMISVSIPLFKASEGDFAFFKSWPAMTIFTSYILAYALRIYIMNYYKNVAGQNLKRDNKAFFAIEQFAAFGTVFLTAILLYQSPLWFGVQNTSVDIFRAAFQNPHPRFLEASFWGSFFGIAAFFSVFIFIFKGRTATFAGLVNRLTSLVAGTFSTLIFWWAFGGKSPKPQDWISLAFIAIAIFFSALAERKRANELFISNAPETEEITVKTSLRALSH